MIYFKMHQEILHYVLLSVVIYIWLIRDLEKVVESQCYTPLDYAIKHTRDRIIMYCTQ